MNEATAFARDYRIVRVLGKGGMGVVYEAEHGPLGRRVALKVLEEGAVSDPTALARLRREALAMGALQHPHVVAVSDFSEGPPPYIAMELLSGQPLRARLAERGPMRVSEACLVAVQLLSALGAAHKAGIIHRDVKPANVFVVETPVTNVFVKLLDFGVAKLLVPSGPALTSVDSVIGSAPYMAPEQICGEPIDGRTDLFAMGILLYEMLAGRRPFVGSAGESVMLVIVRGAPVAPLVGVPPELSAIIARALSRSPAARFATAEEMAAALMPFVAQAEVGALATTAMSSRSPPLAPTLTGARGHPAPPLTTLTGARGHPAPPPPTLTSAPGFVASPPPTLTGAPGFVASPPLIGAPGFPVGQGPMAGASKVPLFIGIFVGLLLLSTVARVAVSLFFAATPSFSPFGASTGSIYGSCRPRTTGADTVCNDYSTSYAAARSKEMSRSLCTESGSGTWSDDGCAHDGARFGCRFTSAGTSVTSWYYAPFTADQALSMCKAPSVILAP
jgi:serine/threonine-protein kinase